MRKIVFFSCLLLLVCVSFYTVCSVPTGTPQDPGAPYTPPDPLPKVDPSFWFKDIYDEMSSSNPVATRQYVCDKINNGKTPSPSLSPDAGTEADPADCEYLLKMIDKANGNDTHYGTGSYASNQAITQDAVDKAVGRIWNVSPVKFVAVSYNYSLGAYSLDGTTWHPMAMPASAGWSSVCYGNGTFVAVSSTPYTYNVPNPADPTKAIQYHAAYSTDGINWIAVKLPANTFWKSVCFGNGKFVAVANNNISWSADGIDWEAATEGVSGSQGWNSVCFDGINFVALDTTNQTAYSTDGKKWKMSSTHWNSVSFGNSKLVALANDKAAYSTDLGSTWTDATTPLLVSGTTKWNSVCSDGTNFVAVDGPGNQIAYSTDGVSWSSVNPPPSPSANWSSVCYDGTNFVAVGSGSGGSNSNATVTSNNGSSWAAGTDLPGAASWSSVCSDGSGNLVAVSNNKYSISNVDYHAAYFTSGGNNWNSLLLSDKQWNSVCFGGGTFVAVANAGIAAHIDGSWAVDEKSLPSSANWSSVCYDGTNFVAVAKSSNKAAYFDGTSWVGVKLPCVADWDSVCYDGGGNLIASADSNQIAVSTDGGQTWDSNPIPPGTANWKSICSNNSGAFVALSSGSIAYSTTKGDTWSKAPKAPDITGSNWNSVCYDGTTFVAVSGSSDQAAQSLDGRSNWTLMNSLPSVTDWNSICSGSPNEFVVISSSGETAYSNDGGTSWTSAELPPAVSWSSVCYGQ